MSGSDMDRLNADGFFSLMTRKFELSIGEDTKS